MRGGVRIHVYLLSRVSALGAEIILEMVGGDSDATSHRECV